MSAKAGAASSVMNPNAPEEALWDVDFENAEHRIGARRSRIKNRLDAARRIKKMIQIKHLFGYHSSDAKETFPVEAQCDASRSLIENVLDNGTELVTNVRFVLWNFTDFCNLPLMY